MIFCPDSLYLVSLALFVKHSGVYCILMYNDFFICSMNLRPLEVRITLDASPVLIKFSLPFLESTSD